MPLETYLTHFPSLLIFAIVNDLHATRLANFLTGELEQVGSKQAANLRQHTNFLSRSVNFYLNLQSGLKAGKVILIFYSVSYRNKIVKKRVSRR